MKRGYLLALLAVLALLLVGGGTAVVVRERRRSADVSSASDYLDDLARWEGDHDFMYRDSRGYVTTAIGVKLDSAEDATAIDWSGAPDEQVRADFASVASAPIGHRETYYAGFSSSRLAPGQSRELSADLLARKFLPPIRKQFPGFDGYPLGARRGIVDVFWNVGAHAHFPKMAAAAEAGDWATAARESHVSTSRPDRNQWRHDVIAAASNEGSAVA
jgi:GH24 family phage-related lysozyme (muramidase)